MMGTRRDADLARLARALGEPIILADVGASGAPPQHWLPFVDSATYVGFDPDARDFSTTSQGVFRTEHRLAKAVTAGDDSTLTFHLTRSPHCSSTLPPNMSDLQHYAMADLFEETGLSTAPAVTLEQARIELSLPRYDWIKLDTQGTDLRVYDSLPSSTRQKLLAIDIEPGLIEAYQGEDTFPKLHERLLQDGFWLAGLKPCGSPRGRQEVTRDVVRRLGLNEDQLIWSCTRAPCWVEAMYLRAAGHAALSSTQSAWLALVAEASGHSLFALDVLERLRRTSELNEWATTAAQLVQERILARRRRRRRVGAIRRIAGLIKRPFRRR